MFRGHRFATWIFISLSFLTVVQAQVAVPAAKVRAIDDEVGFAILVWQFKTDALQDARQYEGVNLFGFHIDRGRGQKSRVDWGVDRDWVYYVDHAAGKGTLHLTDRSGLSQIPRDGTAAIRPHSFSDPATDEQLRRELDRNLPDAISERALAVALDDEVSIGTFNSPLELDFSPDSLRLFQKWMRRAWSDRSAVERAWSESKTDDGQWNPQTYESVRRQITEKPPSQWRLAPWFDFRAFNDEQFSNAIAKATLHAMEKAKGAPVGVVGAQQPSAYGGVDYSRLRDAIQFVEAYDIGGTNEILHSFWSEAPRKPRMQTYFASGNLAADKWFLWYYLAHGNRGVIVWPSIKGNPWFDRGQIHPHVRELAKTFEQVQSRELAPLAHPRTEPVFDPIAVLVSHSSARLGWAIDASAHGKTWPRRSSSLDNSCNSSGKNRVAWTRLLEDLGYQARLVDEKEISNGVLDAMRTRVLILPQSLALDETTCKVIQQFVAIGGTVIADYFPAVTDQHGSGYENYPFAELFGLGENSSVIDSWFDGRQRFEINGERYTRPFAERFSTDDCIIVNQQPLIHRDVNATWAQNPFGDGLAVLINQSPTILFDNETRHGVIGKTWRDKLRRILKAAQVYPEIVTEIDQRDDASGIECLRYQVSRNDQIWSWVANPTRQASVDGAGKTVSLPTQPLSVSISPSKRLRERIDRIVNLRTGEEVALAFPFRIVMPGDEAAFVRVEMKP
ncbi:MAG: hypothetical protein AAGG48_15530 [Planctomycetota bacterium]